MNQLIEHQMDAFEKNELAVGGIASVVPETKICRERVLELYADGELTLAQISALHQVSQSTITVWAKKDGQPARSRGRRALELPPCHLQEALRSLETRTYDQVASVLGVSKARVGYVVKRWRRWVEENHLRVGRERIKPIKTKELLQQREPKPHVLSFRLTKAQVDRLTRAVGDEPVKDRCSIHQLARTVVVRALREMAPQATQKAMP